MPRPEGGGPRPAMGGGIGAGAGGNQGALEMPSLWSFRYMEVTEQSRRVPVAVVLIVDQDHIDRVLTSFNNSKMRFLPTQVLVNQYLGSMQPPAVVDPNGPPGFPGGVGPGPGFGGFGGPGREIMRPPIGGFGGFGGFGGQPGDPGTAVSEPDTNMELVIYGIMTLYQRYPAAPPPPALPVEKKGL